MEDASITGSTGLTPKTHILLVGIVLSILNAGLTAFLTPETGATQQILLLSFAVGFNILTVFWCRYDSRERGEALGRYFTLAVVIFGVFALFYYFFKTRGLKNGLLATGKFILLFFGTTLVSALIFAVLDYAFFNSTLK